MTKQNTKKKIEEKIYVVGDISWTELRQFIIDSLDGCKTENEFNMILFKLLKSVGTPKQLIEARKKVGMPVDLLKKQLKEMEEKAKAQEKENKK